MSFEPESAPAPGRPRIVVAERAFVWRWILVANLAWFGFMWTSGVSPLAPEGLERFGALHGPLVVAGEHWRLLSCMFVHVGFVHLAFNMYALYVLGPAVERLYGNAGFALLYALSGLGGSFASVLWRPADSSAGASGAIFGLLGALLAFNLRHRRELPHWMASAQTRNLLVLIAINVGIGFLVPMVDNAGHIGGLLLGLLAGGALGRDLVSSPRLDARRAKRAALVALLFVAAAPAMVWRVRTDERAGPLEAEERARAAFFADDLDGAERAALEATERGPSNAVAWTILTEVRARRGDLERALEAADRAVDADPESAHARFLRGWLLFARGDVQSASDELERAVRLDPESRSYRFVRGQIAFALGRYEDARREFVRVSVHADAEGEEALAWSWLARVRLGFAPSAGLETGIGVAGTRPNAWIAALATLPRDDERAGEVLEHAAAGEPRAEARTQLFLGEWALARGERAVARARFERAAKLYESTKAIGVEPLFVIARLRELERS